MAEAISGKRLIYLYRAHADAATVDGAQIAFTTENGRTKSKDADSTATKDGSIRTPGTAEIEITCTSILSRGDVMLDRLETAMDNDELLDIWEANLDEPVDPTYALTSDQALVSGKTYYTRSGSEGSYTYTAVASPVVGDIGSYYEVTNANKYKGRYFQGYLTEIEYTSNAEDMVEASTTFGINGGGKPGNVTVTAEQAAAADYVFTDTPKTGA